MLKALFRPLLPLAISLTLAACIGAPFTASIESLAGDDSDAGSGLEASAASADAHDAQAQGRATQAPSDDGEADVVRLDVAVGRPPDASALPNAGTTSTPPGVPDAAPVDAAPPPADAPLACDPLTCKPDRLCIGAVCCTSAGVCGCKEYPMDTCM